MRSTRVAADEAHARFGGARADLLRAVAELESTEAWRGDGAGDLASWLAARWQIALRTARELVRDARELRARPALGEALGKGSVSVDQCRALMVLCREQTGDDEVWLEALPFWSLPELEREARKQVARELERRDGGTYLRMRHTADERYLRGEFQLQPEEGAVLIGAIDALVPQETRLRDWDRASAAALVELAKGGTAVASTQRPTVLLSVSETVLAGERGAGDVASLGSGGLVGTETARRIACDSRTQLLYRDEGGKITGIGRTSRTVPAWMRRAVEERDGGTCTFPACERDVHLECHHILPVAQGGPTVLDNLLLVCWTHHKLAHEGGWSLRGEAGPHITWVRPDGSAFEPRVRVVLDTS